MRHVHHPDRHPTALTALLAAGALALAGCGTQSLRNVPDQASTPTETVPDVVATQDPEGEPDVEGVLAVGAQTIDADAPVLVVERAGGDDTRMLLVVRTDADGAPGDLLGVAEVGLSVVEDVPVELTMGEVPTGAVTLWVTLVSDVDPIGRYDEGIDQVVVDVRGEELRTPVDVVVE
ncbi:MAG: hypothetical protein ACLGIR_04785 [Actinomycetes bacterium]